MLVNTSTILTGRVYVYECMHMLVCDLHVCIYRFISIVRCIYKEGEELSGTDYIGIYSICLL